MVQKFYSGETLSAAKLNGMVDEINSIKRQIDEQRIVDFEGGDLDVSANGTVLSVRPMRAHVGGNSSTAASDHPFKVSASYADGKVSISMKGGCWHGNGAGNYLGISYLEKPAAELTDIPTLKKGEDLFIIPDCEISQSVSVGEMFAICLYSPATDGGKLVNYPWAYFKKITSAADFRQELADYAFAAVAIVGIWKLKAATAKDGSEDLTATPVLTGAPGQMIHSDFFYKNNQVFSSGKFGWSRVDGVKFGFHVSDGLVYVRPNNIAGATVPESALSIRAAASELAISIPQKIYSIDASTELSETTLVKRFEETDNNCEVSKTVRLSIPTVTGFSTSTRDINFVSDITVGSTSRSTSILVPTYSALSETLSATPNNDKSWTRTLLKAPLVEGCESRTVTLSVPTVSKSSSSATFVTGVSASTETVSRDVEVSVCGKKYELETEKAQLSKINSIRLVDNGCEAIELDPIETKEFSAAECTDIDKIRELLGITEDTGGVDSSKIAHPFFIAVGGQDFQLSDDELKSGILVGLRVKSAAGSVDVSWVKIESVAPLINADWPYNDENNEFYLIIDQQIGGNWVEGSDSKGIDQTTLASSGAAFSIDYVRVYSTSEYAHIIPEPSAFGLLAGIGALALAISRRRRK